MKIYLKNKWLKITLAIFAAILFLTLGYFLGLAALITALFTAFISALFSIFTLIWGWIITIIGGACLTALAATIAGWFAAIWAWFTATWLGTFIMPFINWILPIFAKISPFLTTGKIAKHTLTLFKKLRQRGKKEIKNAITNIQKP